MIASLSCAAQSAVLVYVPRERDGGGRSFYQGAAPCPVCLCLHGAPLVAAPAPRCASALASVRRLGVPERQARVPRQGGALSPHPLAHVQGN